MVEGDRRHARPSGWGRILVRAAVVLVVLALVVGAGWQLGLADRWDLADRLGLEEEDPRRNPAAVEPPPGLDLPEPPDARPVADPLRKAAPDAAAVRRAVGRLLDDRRLGRRVGLAVGGLDGRSVVAEGPAVVTPASTLKLLTCLAALEALGPEHRFTTEVVGAGRDITLVGGGDPLLSRRPVRPDEYPAQADIATLAADTAAKLRRDGFGLVRLRYDDTLFSGPAGSPDWEPDYLPDDVVSPITSLWVDQGRIASGDSERSTDPARDAADAFAAALRREGINVVGQPTQGAPPADAEELAAVRGAELVEVVRHVLEVSDNEAAEVLARHVALAEGLPGSFDGAGRAVTSVVERLGIPVQGALVLDGSGLARGNRLDVRTLLETLAVGAGPAAPELGGLAEGLPVAGFNGSLGYRFATDADEALGWVRAKTGTLVAGGVHALAGIVTARDGTPMLFAVVADRVKEQNTLFVRDRLDQVAAALAGCACAG
ncbi:MAG: D-alanyl-D-alanine carboxypeptidase [uncultured Nocardioidaceae bacterium]|uniref:D-alanyl-D-alanine carboxypeptidase n=1 Tax=uncultured Nocardioidaceae bacterium TaxID=253824 RepID=A0A6J4N0P6_9ACTN|nr:MAG: D-alanyl-D-alanine carboxypeptidase [uncultured Nocardioidaceae bacterium]